MLTKFSNNWLFRTWFWSLTMDDSMTFTLLIRIYSSEESQYLICLYVLIVRFGRISILTQNMFWNYTQIYISVITLWLAYVALHACWLSLPSVPCTNSLCMAILLAVVSLYPSARVLSINVAYGSYKSSYIALHAHWSFSIFLLSTTMLCFSSELTAFLYDYCIHSLNKVVTKSSICFEICYFASLYSPFTHMDVNRILIESIIDNLVPLSYY